MTERIPAAAARARFKANGKRWVDKAATKGGKGQTVAPDLPVGASLVVEPTEAQRRHKYGAKAMWYHSPLNGLRWYPSIRQGRRAVDLDLMKAQGRVEWWLPEVRFCVGTHPTTRRPIHHVVDFMVCYRDPVLDEAGQETGRYKRRLVLEDTKSPATMTDLFNLKAGTVQDRYGMPVRALL